MPSFDARDLVGGDQDVATLAGTLVHEVKNPLSTLNISTQLLLEEWSHPSTPREKRIVKRLQVMRAEIARIERIIDSFLRFTRQQILDSASGDLNALLADLMRNNEEGLERKGIRVHFQPAEDLPTVRFDENILRQAFLNLLRNAEQAMPEGGELIVRTRRSKDVIELEFIDTGGGIPEDRLPRIFEPYFSSKESGTGLGLPTTLRIIHGHGGNLRVESEVGKGSRFVVTFPCREGSGKP